MKLPWVYEDYAGDKLSVDRHKNGEHAGAAVTTDGACIVVVEPGKVAEFHRAMAEAAGLEEPIDIDEAVLDMAREDERVNWEESHPGECERAEHLDLPLIEMVWDAAWTAALDAVASLRGQS